MVLLEDLQWVGESLAPLQQMLRVKDQIAHVFVLGTYRDDEKPELPDALPDMHNLNLQRLDATAIANLSASILGEAGTRPEVVDLLQRETEGNAFFMVEIVRALAEDAGRLVDIGRMTLPEHVFAYGVHQVVQRRLDGLSTTIRAWLKPIAVAGRILDMAIVYSLTPSPEDYLIECVESAVLEVVDNTWRFRHDKIREAILDELTDDERPRLHRQIADTIEAIYPENDDYNEVLLEHWQQSGNLDKATPYLNAVANHLIRVAADFDHALMLLARGLQDLEADDPRRITLLNLQAMAFSRQGLYDQAFEVANQALKLAQQTDDEQGIATSLRNLSYAVYVQGDYEEARRYDEQSLTIAQAAAYQEGIAQSLNGLGNIAYVLSEYDQARDFYQQSAAIAEQIGEQRGYYLSLSMLGGVAYIQGDYETARQVYEECLSFAQETGNQFEISEHMAGLGEIAYRLGDFDSSVQYFEQCLVIEKSIGAQRSVAASLDSLGHVKRLQEDYKRATDYLNQSLTIFQGIGDQFGIAYALHHQGDVAYWRGDYAQAEESYQQSLTIRQTIKHQNGIANTLGNLGNVYLKIEHDQAQTTLHEALSIAHSIQSTPIILELLVSFAWLHLQADKLLHAAELIGLVQNHPSSHSGAWAFVKAIQPELETALSPNALAAAMERGKSLGLDTVVQEILDEFGDEA